MAEQQSGLSEAAGVGTAVSDLLKPKRTAPFAKAVKGGVGGAAGAAIGMALEHKEGIKKSAAAITAALMLPVLFLTMLPGLTFGDLSENSGVLNSGTLINENLQKANQAIVEVLMECHDEVLAEIQQEASKVPEGDTVSITDPYASSISVNSNLLIAQFCASRESYKEINIKELQKVIRDNKDDLFSYDVSTETVTMEVEVDAGAEGESGNVSTRDDANAGNASTAPQTKTVTFTRHNYVVKYAGDTYFADHVFRLTDKQKELAEAYAENLELFFGSSASGVATANVSEEVLAYRATVERIAAKYGMSQYVELILAVMMQESGGRGTDVMQASESGYNQKYPHSPGSITDPEYSIECGIQALKHVLTKAGCTGPTDLDRIKLALQGYNYGSGYIDWAMARDGGYTKENAIAYSDMMCARPGWHYSV